METSMRSRVPRPYAHLSYQELQELIDETAPDRSRVDEFIAAIREQVIVRNRDHEFIAAIREQVIVRNRDHEFIYA